MDPGNTEQNADDFNAELSSAMSFVSDSSMEGDIADSLLPEDDAAQNVRSDYEPGEASQSLFHTNSTTVDDDDVDDKLVAENITAQDVSSHNVRATPEILGSLFSPKSGVAEDDDMQVESQDESCSLEEDGLRKNISMLCDQLLTSPDTKEDVKNMNDEENGEQKKNAATVENEGHVGQRKNTESTGNDGNIDQRKNTESMGNDRNIDQSMNTKSVEPAEIVDQRKKETCTLSTQESCCQKNSNRGRQTCESERTKTQFAGPGDEEDIRVSADRPGEEEISQQSRFTCPRPETDDEQAEKCQDFSADLETRQTCKGDMRNSDFTKSITLSPKLQQTKKGAQKFKVPYDRKGIDPCSAEKDSRPAKDYMKCAEKEHSLTEPICTAEAIEENVHKRIVAEESRIGEFSQKIYEATPKVSTLSGESELITSKRSKNSGQKDSGRNGEVAGVMGYVQRDREVVQRCGSDRISGRCNRDTAKIAHTEHDVIRDSADADVIGDEGSDVTLPPQSVKIRHSQSVPDRDSQRSLESDSWNSKRLLDTVKDITHKVSAERQVHTEEIVIIERIRHIYERASAAQVSANDQASLTQSLEKVIRQINKRQKEEKSALAEKVKTGKMTPKEKGKTKQQLQNLSLRCTALQTLFKSHQMLKTKFSAEAKKPRMKGLQANSALKKTQATRVAEDCRQEYESVCGKVSVMETHESQAENDLEDMQGPCSGPVAGGALHRVNTTENNMTEIQGPVSVSVPGGTLSHANNTAHVVSSDNTNKSSVASRCADSSQKSCPPQGVSDQEGRQNTENADEYLDSDSQTSQSILHPKPTWKRPKNTSVPALPSSKTEIYNVSKVASPAERLSESAIESTKSRSKRVQEELTETTELVSRPVSGSEREVTPDERHSTSPGATQTFAFVEQDPVTASTNSTATRQCQSSKVSASSPKSLTNLKGIDGRPRNENIVSNDEDMDERSDHNADNWEKDDLDRQNMNETNADIAASEIQQNTREAATVHESVDFMETQDPALGKVLYTAVSPQSQTEPMDGLIENISSTIQTHTFDTLTVPFDCNSQSSVIADSPKKTPVFKNTSHLSQHSEFVSQSILQQHTVTASTAMFDSEIVETQHAICNPVSQCFEDDDDCSEILIDCIQRESKPFGNDAISREDFVGLSRVPNPCSGIIRTKCPIPQNNSQSSKSSSSSRKRSRSSSSSQGVGSDRENATKSDNASPSCKSQRMNSLLNNEGQTSTLPAADTDAISTAKLGVSREAREHVPTEQPAEGMDRTGRSESCLHTSTEGSSKTASTLQNTTISTQKYRSARTEDITNSASQSQPSILSVSVNAQGSLAKQASNTETATPVSAEKGPVQVIIVNCSSKVDVGSKSLLQTKVAQMTPSTLEKPKCATPRPAQIILPAPKPGQNLACTSQRQPTQTPSQSVTAAPSQNVTSKQPQNTDTPRDTIRKPTQLGPRNSAPQPIPHLTAPRRPSSPSSTVTSMTMTDVFPVSSREILRKMAKETVFKQKESITKQPAADLRQRETDSYQNEAASGGETEPGSKGADPRPLGGRSTQHTEVSRVDWGDRERAIRRLGPGDTSGDRERAIRRLGPGDTSFRRDADITGDVYSDIASLGSAAREGETSWPLLSQSGSKFTRPGAKFGKERNETLPKKTTGGGMSSMPPRYRELLDSGVILPGRLCLSVHEKGREKKASIMTDGRIEDSAGLTFANPLSWYRAVSGLPRIKRSRAYSTISYNGHSLAVVCGRTHLLSPNPTSSSNTATSNATTRTATANPNIAETLTTTRLPQERSAIHQENSRSLSGSCSNQPSQWQENTGVHKSSLLPPTQTTVSSLDAGVDGSAHLCADKMLSSLRKLRLVADEEIASHSTDCELTSFWSADFAKITMSQNFWATVDDWD
ncbi:serine-rich adhesin for platelets-like [Littorina saxatilis]|uniref:serine-rich adhesin for platelets-like n=1 Tax=Littorina saxatilis TaxID=31220 RepID=UPI0038B53163